MPIASAIAGSAATGMMDMRTVRIDNGMKHPAGAEEGIEKERQRKFLLQIQKNRMLAAAQVLHGGDGIHLRARENDSDAEATQNITSEMEGW